MTASIRAHRPVVHTPRADILTDDSSVTILVDLPGIRPGDLRVQLERGVLFLDATERTSEGEVRARHRRAIALQRQVDPDGIRATLEHGVLTLELPRNAVDRPRTIPVVAT
jgi:HSP20 family molecular chaperone IbpA